MLKSRILKVVTMIWFHVVMFTCAAAVFLILSTFNRSKRFNAPTMYLEPTPNGVIVRQYPIERMLASDGKLVGVDSVNKVQITKGLISVFKHSGAAYDMWVPNRFEHDLLEHAKKLFPHAEFVQV